MPGIAPKRLVPPPPPPPLDDRRATRRAAAKQRAIRTKNDYAQAFANAGYDEMAAKLRECQETKSLMCCSHCSAHWYAVTNCRQRVCPCCSYKVSQDRARFLRALCRKLKHPKLITLTMPAWRSDPREGIKSLRDSVKLLRRQRVFAGVRGGAYSIEVLPRGSYWHIHIHLVVDAPFIPYQKLFTAWRLILNLSHVEIDIRAAGSAEAQGYIAKYVSKSGHGGVDTDDIVLYYEAIKGIRLWGTFGDWYNATLEDIDDEKIFTPPPPVCPCCGATGSVFFARDGPFVLGAESWKEYLELSIGKESFIIPNVSME